MPDLDRPFSNNLNFAQVFLISKSNGGRETSPVGEGKSSPVRGRKQVLWERGNQVHRERGK
jgi:hypothetical protein